MESPQVKGTTSTTSDCWEEQWEELKAFKAQHGHFNVKSKTVMASWIRKQRLQFKDGILPLDRFYKLISIEFPFGSIWEQRFEELKAFEDEHGHLKVPRKEYPILRAWIYQQQDRYAKGKLPKEKFERLQSIDFPFEFQSRKSDKDALWDQRFEELKAFRDKNGHLKVSITDCESLYLWIDAQQRRYKKQQLSKEHMERLRSIGFDSEDYKSQPGIGWERKFVELRAFQDKHGHLKVPAEHRKPLHQWIQVQREHFKQQKLSTERIEKLQSIGFDFEDDGGKQPGMTWEQGFQELISFKDKHGHFKVLPEHCKTLNQWVHDQQEHYQQQKLSKERLEKLVSIGFSFDVSDGSDDWERRLEELKAFQVKHGHIKVPKSSRTLHPWILQQRKSHEEGKLVDDRIRQLQLVPGFSFHSSGNAKRKGECLEKEAEESSDDCVPSLLKDDSSRGNPPTTTPPLRQKSGQSCPKRRRLPINRCANVKNANPTTPVPIHHQGFAAASTHHHNPSTSRSLFAKYPVGKVVAILPE